MKRPTQPHNKAYTLIETALSTSVLSVVGLTLCSLVNTTTILGAKNTALNTAHQQARTAMVQMLQDLHSSISLPSLVDTSGNQVSGAGPAAGIAFQQWSSGPHKIKFDASTGETPEAIRFRVAVSRLGEIRFCFPMNSSGDHALDEQARLYLARCRFPKGAPDDSKPDALLTWGIATIEWGSDIKRPHATQQDSATP